MTLDWGSQSINDNKPPPWASYFNFWLSSCWVSMPDGPTETDPRMTRTPASVVAPSTSRITTAIIITIINRTHHISHISSLERGSPTSCWFWQMIKMLNLVRTTQRTACCNTHWIIYYVALLNASVYIERRIILFIACDLYFISLLRRIKLWLELFFVNLENVSSITWRIQFVILY